MNYYAFVSRPTELRIRMEHKMEDVQFKWTTCINTVPQMGEKVQSSLKNSTEASIIRYTEAKAQLDALAEKYDKAVSDVRAFLYECLDLDDADVLDWKYCGGKSIQDIADLKEISYSGAANRISRAEAKAMKAYKMGNFEKE